MCENDPQTSEPAVAVDTPPNGDVTLNQLRVFARVVKLGQVSAVARELGVSQPSISQQLRRLEHNLGFGLFEPGERKTNLTPRGWSLYRLCRAIGNATGDIERMANQVRAGTYGSLSIAAHSTAATHFVANLARSFSSSMPGVALSLSFGLYEEVAAAVESGEADIGLVPGPADYQRFDAQKLFAIDVVLVASPADRLGRRRRASWEELGAVDVAFAERGRGPIEEELRARGILLNRTRVRTYPNAEQAAKAAEAGLAVAFVPRESVLRELQHRYLVEIAVPNLKISRPFELLRRKGEPPTRAQTAFAEIASQLGTLHQQSQTRTKW